mgnify:CR=1 FL=1
MGRLLTRGWDGVACSSGGRSKRGEMGTYPRPRPLRRRARRYALEFGFEQVRIGTVWLAYWLLRTSKGGPSHFLQLEKVRRHAITPSDPGVGMRPCKRVILRLFDCTCYNLVRSGSYVNVV